MAKQSLDDQTRLVNLYRYYGQTDYLNHIRQLMIGLMAPVSYILACLLSSGASLSPSSGNLLEGIAA